MNWSSQLRHLAERDAEPRQVERVAVDYISRLPVARELGLVPLETAEAEEERQPLDELVNGPFCRRGLLAFLKPGHRRQAEIEAGVAIVPVTNEQLNEQEIHHSVR